MVRKVVIKSFELIWSDFKYLCIIHSAS